MKGIMQRNPIMLGYVLSAVIFTILIYALMFEGRANSITNCEKRNEQALVTNQNHMNMVDLVGIIERYMAARLAGDKDLIAEGPSVVEITLANLDRIEYRPLSVQDCDEVFEKPWPFG